VPTISKVLLVEDNFYIRDIYSITLKEAGYNLEVAVDGDEALAKAKSFAPELIFLDIMIPGHSGLEVLKVLREDASYGCQEAKIILLTNFDQDEATKQALTSHADGYIIKANITPSDLIELTKSYLEAKPDGGDKPAA
jgi:CheY-like chemotaxis protein